MLNRNLLAICKLHASNRQMNANAVLLAADEFQRYQLEISVSARSQSLARAEATARAMIRVLDKAATLAALNKRLRRN